jgi:hypothetical protein
VSPRFVLCLLLCTGSLPAAIDEPLKKILEVGREGSGNASAAEGLAALSASTLDDLPVLIKALATANPLAGNYIRAAIDALVDRETTAGRSLPLAPLADILLDPGAGDQPRSLAFDLIRRASPKAAERMIPGFLSDPNTELRRLAVENLIQTARDTETSGLKDDATLLYGQASAAARDVDQIRSLADILAKRGQPVDIPRRMGFLMHWDVIGPFDNTTLQGFAKAYPPEAEWKADAVYPGKSGEVRWQPLVTSDSYGKVDFNTPFGMLKETTAYARTTFLSDRDQAVELRLGCKNAWKIWVNGQLLFGRDEYHRGQRIDQYILPAKFRTGPNVILVKCCQNEQTQDWTVQWEFQLRVCDQTGNAVLATDRPPTPKPQEARRRPAPTQ